MDNTVDLLVNNEDYFQIKYLFEQDSDPDFTIISEDRVDDNSVRLQIYFTHIVVFWALAKRVEMWNAHNKRMKEIESQIKCKNDNKLG